MKYAYLPSLLSRYYTKTNKDDEELLTIDADDECEKVQKLDTNVTVKQITVEEAKNLLDTALCFYGEGKDFVSLYFTTNYCCCMTKDEFKKLTSDNNVFSINVKENVDKKISEYVQHEMMNTMFCNYGHSHEIDRCPCVTAITYRAFLDMMLPGTTKNHSFINNIIKDSDLEPYPYVTKNWSTNQTVTQYRVKYPYELTLKDHVGVVGKIDLLRTRVVSDKMKYDSDPIVRHSNTNIMFDISMPGITDNKNLIHRSISSISSVLYIQPYFCVYDNTKYYVENYLTSINDSMIRIYDILFKDFCSRYNENDPDDFVKKFKSIKKLVNKYEKATTNFNNINITDIFRFTIYYGSGLFQISEIFDCGFYPHNVEDTFNDVSDNIKYILDQITSGEALTLYHTERHDESYSCYRYSCILPKNFEKVADPKHVKFEMTGNKLTIFYYKKRQEFYFHNSSEILDFFSHFSKFIKTEDAEAIVAKALLTGAIKE